MNRDRPADVVSVATEREDWYRLLSKMGQPEPVMEHLLLYEVGALTIIYNKREKAIYDAMKRKK